MIVRSLGKGWLLLAQRDHALLSAELASAMHLPPFDALQDRRELIAAIACHDDGWEQWDAAMCEDDALGRPCGFDEMKRLDALEIWRQSIKAAAAKGGLAGWTVASHFLRLTKRDTGDPSVIEFQHWARTKRQTWLGQWLRDDTNRDAQKGEAAVNWLQFFDAFSLNLCRGCKADIFPLTTPDGEKITMKWLNAGDVELQPWPFSRPTLRLMLHATPYPTLAKIEPVKLRWQLRPQGSLRS